MARTRTLALLEADVRWQCDQEGATLRHTSAQVRRQINQAIQRFRLKISQDAGLPYYLTDATGTLTAGAESSTQPWTLLTHGITNLVWIRSVAVTYQGETHQLQEAPFDAIYEMQEGGNTTTGYPRAFTSPNTTEIFILPASNGAYPYQIWYLPAGTDLSADGDTFDGLAGWEDWVVLDTCIRLLLRDEHSEEIGPFEGYKAQIWEDIMAAKVRGRAGPHKRLDRRGMRYAERYTRRWQS